VGIYSRTADEDEVFVRHEKLADATRYLRYDYSACICRFLRPLSLLIARHVPCHALTRPCAACRRDATEQLLKTLTPESTTYLNSRTLASLLTQKEEKQGETLLTIGQSMQQADQYTVHDISLSLSPRRPRRQRRTNSF
jgi:hypothetical protein